MIRVVVGNVHCGHCPDLGHSRHWERLQIGPVRAHAHDVAVLEAASDLLFFRHHHILKAMRNARPREKRVAYPIILSAGNALAVVAGWAFVPASMRVRAVSEYLEIVDAPSRIEDTFHLLDGHGRARLWL